MAAVMRMKPRVIRIEIHHLTSTANLPMKNIAMAVINRI